MKEIRSVFNEEGITSSLVHAEYAKQRLGAAGGYLAEGDHAAAAKGISRK